MDITAKETIIILRAKIIELNARREALAEYTLNKDFQLEAQVVHRTVQLIEKKIHDIYFG